MKRKYLIVLVSLLGLITLPACITSNTIKGDGNCVKHTIPVADYDQIKISGAHVVLNYSQDIANGFLEVEVDQNIYDIFSFKVKKGKLLIEPEKQSWNTNVHPTCFIVTTSSREFVSLTVDGGVTFTTHTPLQSEYLNIKIRGVGNVDIKEEVVVKDIKVSISGSGNIKMPQIATNSFHASIPGSGDLRLGGTAEEATFKIYGSGSVYAYDLVTRNCESTILGSGGVQITATERVKGKITGSGDVLYKGQPAEVERKVLGSGNVRSVD